MKKLFLLLIILLGIQANAQQIYHQKMLLMGSRFDISVVANSQAQGDAYIQMAVNEIKRIENIISSWKPDTETSKINRNAGIKPVKVSAELFNLIKRALAISKLTDGAFDISYAAMDKIWHFDGSMTKMPDSEIIKNSVRNVGYQHIILDEAKQTVFLERKGMKIGFGAIGKGYAADKAKQLLQSKGVTAGIINASGDMITWGRQPDGIPWTVAITNPMDKSKAFGLFRISDRAVVTSGDYEKFVRFNGVRYAHIINPKTGYPATGIISATVFAPKAELADALATSVFVMGKDVGIDRINQIPNVECIIVDEKGQVFTSKNIHINPIKQKK